MFTTTQFGALTLFVLSASKDVLARPLYYRQASNSTIGNFGSCTVPQIQFATGFDNRKETSFEPVDQVSYNHGSADNIDIITQFMCDTLVNSCGADATAQATCATATTAADGQTAKTGAQADAFNAVFGITTNFAAVAEISDQGSTVAAGVGAAATAADSASTAAAASATVTSAAEAASATDCVGTVTVTVSAAATDSVSSAVAATSAVDVAVTSSAAAASASSTASASSIGDFGSCSIPQIEFATGFDGRTETSFQPVDQVSYNHGSADNIDIITQFMCDTLVNSCGADATAQATCATATTAADGQTAKTGAQADAFNAVFGITTNFAAVAEISDQGATVAAGVGAAATSAAVGAVATSAAVGAAATSAAVVSTAAAASVTSAAAVASSSASSSSIGDFGSCTVPQIEFGVGFDNRKETAFQPVDQTSFNHGSADNIAVITQFICNTLTNTCNADATAKATCASATTAAAAALGQTGAQADAFNAVFGITTQFSQVPVVSNTGVTLGVDGTNTAAAATATA
jgi:hypothetical protein